MENFTFVVIPIPSFMREVIENLFVSACRHLSEQIDLTAVCQSFQIPTCVYKNKQLNDLLKLVESFGYDVPAVFIRFLAQITKTYYPSMILELEDCEPNSCNFLEG
jgi:hypothetical protein